MAKPARRGRRRFLIGSVLLGGALYVGYRFARRLDRQVKPEALSTKPNEVAMNGWLKIAANGEVTVLVPRQEMGQGVYTALPMLVAEELDVDWSMIRAEQAPVAQIYANVTMIADAMPVDPADRSGIGRFTRWLGDRTGEALEIQATGGSTSVRDAWEPLRTAGASARTLLVQAAAKRWKVPEKDCTTELGAVLHKATGRRATYGELAAESAAVTPPQEPVLKDPSQYRLIGKSPARLDVPAKVDGSAQFGIDMRLPDMVYAAVAQCPVFGGKLKAFEFDKVKSMVGVISALPVANGVALVANSHWRAKQALAALPITWDEGATVALDSAAIRAQFMRDLEQGDPSKYRGEGDALAALGRAAKVVEALYEAPFLAHACMEPINCTARVANGACEVWVGNQSPSLVRWIAAKTADVPSQNVTVHTPYLGGGFGRRVELDVVVQAVTLAKALAPKPVQVLWSREEDLQHDVYRPAAVSRFKAALDTEGKPIAWWNRIVGPSPTLSIMERIAPWPTMDMPDKTTAEGSSDMPYEIPDLLVEHVLSKTPVPVGFWRSVGHSYNAFFKECFMDEMAMAAGKDPFEFRRSLLQQHPRHRKVLEVAAEKAGWGGSLPQGVARGIALHESFRSIVAQVAEVSLGADQSIRVRRVVCAVDCGHALHPDIVTAQMESGIVFGLSAALFGEITLAKGRVIQTNFPNYDMVRLAETPAVEVHIVDSGADLGGVGEPGVPPLAPAVANALFALTGNRLRKLPLRLTEDA